MLVSLRKLSWLFAMSLGQIGGSALAVEGISTSGVNYRTEPGGEVLGVIPEGERIRNILRREGDWYVVEYAGRTGYVHADYLTPQGAVPGTQAPASTQPDTTPASTSTPSTLTAPRPLPRPSNLPTTAQGVSTAGVNFRASPNGTKLGVMPEGTSFNILRREGNWYVVNYGGRTGYVYGDYVRASASTGPTTGTATAGVNFRDANNRQNKLGVIPRNTNFEIIERTGNWYRVRYQGQEGVVFHEYVRENQSVAPVMPIPRPEGLASPATPPPLPLPRPENLTTPATVETPAEEAPAAETPTAVDPALGYVTTTAPGGNVALDAIDQVAPSTVNIEDPNLVEALPYAPSYEDLASGAQVRGETTDRLNFRRGDGSIIRTLDDGAEFSIIGKQGDWLKIEQNGDTGWVHSNYVDYYGDIPTITEAQSGVDCENCDNAPSWDDIRDLANHISEVPSDSPMACLTRRMVEGAKTVYNNRSRYITRADGTPLRPGGYCALGVRKALNVSGIDRRWLGLGDANQTPNNLRGLGFRNLMEQNPNLTPETAPPGTILVYDGSHPNVCTGTAGDRVGHIEIKYEEGGQEYYSSDLRSTQPRNSFSAWCRPLIGVYRLEDCRYCSEEAKRACGLL